MADGFCLEWTAWRIWCHPQRARQVIEDADMVENELRKRLEEALTLLEKQRKETSNQSFRVAELSRRLSETEIKLTEEHRELEEMRLQLHKALDTIAEQQSVEEMVRAFDSKVAEVEKMKHNYEKRITELQARLADARKRLGRIDNDELGEPIDMTRQFQRGYVGPVRKELTEPRPVIPSSSSDYHSSSSDYNSGSNSERTPTDSSGSKPHYPEIEIPPIRPKAGRSDDDWLSELPDF